MEVVESNESDLKSLSENERNDTKMECQNDDNTNADSSKETDVTKTIDPRDAYGYTKTSNFTSEIYKIEIANLPKYFSYGECKKLMTTKLKLKPHKIKLIKQINKAYVTFKCEEDKVKAAEKVAGFVYKGKTLSVKNAKPKQDAMATVAREGPATVARESAATKRGCDDNVTSESKKLKEGETENVEEALQNSVTPWWKKPYAEQLDLKQAIVEESLAEFRRSVCNLDLDVELFRWFMQNKKEGGACCPVNRILPSPVHCGYRNKCGFTVSRNLKGEPCVGFRLGKYRDQVCAVEEPNCVLHVPDKMKEVTASFTRYIRCSDLQVYDAQIHEGHWRTLTARTNLKGNVLVVIALCRQNLSDEKIESEQQKILDHFTADGVDVDTLLLQPLLTHRSNADEFPLTLVKGEGAIYEELFGVKFRISPLAFFQCNTRAAEVLYKTIGDFVRGETLGNEAILLDVCCGTGTIGITLAKSVKRVIGVDICKQAIEDARINAEINGISNCEFHCGKAEDLLPDLVQPFLSATNVSLVAVVDPPRCGLHQKVVKTLRMCTAIQKIIYVSCSIDQARTNFINFCRPQSKRTLGRPFLPTVAQPLDLYPHTKHVEVVMMWQRVAAQESATESVASDSNVPQENATESVASDSNVPQENATKSVASDSNVPQENATESVASDSNVPQESATESVASDSNVPQENATKSVASDSNVPQENATEYVASDSNVPQESATESVAGDSNVPQESATESVASDSNVPQENATESVASDSNVPQETEICK